MATLFACDLANRKPAESLGLPPALCAHPVNTHSAILLGAMQFLFSVGHQTKVTEGLTELPTVLNPLFSEKAIESVA